MFLPLSAYPKPRTAFLEEREDDEDLSMNNTVFACLNWKEILSLTDDYYQVNLFLVGHDNLIYMNFMLPKSLYWFMIRIEIMKTMASTREAWEEVVPSSRRGAGHVEHPRMREGGAGGRRSTTRRPKSGWPNGENVEKSRYRGRTVKSWKSRGIAAETW